MNEQAYCFACGTTHPLTTFVENGELFGRLECPREHGRRRRLSSDAELFFRFRREAAGDVRRRYQFALVHITGSCSMRCPNCFAQSGAGVPIPMETVLSQVRAARKAGVRAISFTGGEPTEHPDLEEIVRQAAASGLMVSLLTNGIGLAKDGLALRLKRAGLSAAAISFDTFTPAVSVALRGGDYVAVKLQAFQRCLEAGLKVSANVTVFERNLHELGAVFKGLAMRFPNLTHVLLQPFRAFGRSQSADCIDRERIVRALNASEEFPAAEPEAFFAFPLLPAFGLAVHPDCCAFCPVSVSGQGASAVLATFATERSMRLFAARLRLIRDGWRPLVVLKALLAWCRFVGWRRSPILRKLCRRSRQAHVVLAVVDNLPDPDFMLTDRIDRCASAVVGADGTLLPICAAYRRGEVRLS